MEIITVKNLSFSYAGKKRRALDSINLSVNSGDFVVLCGATGSGKSTLLRMIKRELTPNGEKEGSVFYKGQPIESLSDSQAASSIGFVMQRPEQQIVTDKVWHELAFGLENIGCPQNEMRRRIAETAQFFGIEDWYEHSTDELSGGQKQLLNLAAITVMQPDVLILDEPTSRLDPVAASEFLEALGRLNKETGMTVLLVEHHLEKALSLCTKMVILRSGSIIQQGVPREVCSRFGSHADMLSAMPAAVRLYSAVPAGDICPLTVRDGREWISRYFSPDTQKPIAPPAAGKSAAGNNSPALEMKNVFYRYSRGGSDILNDATFTVNSGEIFCILGGNGSGKTTAMKAAAGLIKLYSGEVRIFGRRIKEYSNGSLYHNCVAMLPQDVQTLFLRSTVREELADSNADTRSLPFDLSPIMERHPYDLSGGEQQMVALAKVLAAKPRLLLLDEPTNGLDAQKRKSFIDILKKLRESGITIVIVTHDTDFAAAAADRCALFFRGNVVASDEPHRFFSGSTYYTTATSRMTRGFFEGCILTEEAAALCRSCRKAMG